MGFNELISSEKLRQKDLHGIPICLNVTPMSESLVAAVLTVKRESLARGCGRGEKI